METLPADKTASYGPVVNGKTEKLYAKKHNPFMLFADIANNPQRAAQVKPYRSFAADMASGNVPNFVWISPNQCNDMHGGVYTAIPGHPETPCPYGSTKDDANDAALKHKADDFTWSAVQTIQHSKAWTRSSAIVIVTDENDYTGNKTLGGWESAAGRCDTPYVAAHDPRVSATWPGGTYGGGLIPAVAVTSHGPRHAVSQTPYNHYSLLRTIEDNWNLGHLRFSGDTAGGVLPMTDLLTPTGRRDEGRG